MGVVRNGQMGLLISSGQPKAACRFAQQRCERARRTRDPQFPLALPTALISRVASSKAFLLLHLHLVVHYRPSISISTSRQTVAWKLGAWCLVLCSKRPRHSGTRKALRRPKHSRYTGLRSIISASSSSSCPGLLLLFAHHVRLPAAPSAQSRSLELA